MSSILHSCLRLPTIKRFLDNALSQLRDGVSGLFLLPKTIPIDDFQLQFRNELALRRIDYQEIDLSQETADVSPVSCLCKAIDIQWKDPLAPRVITQMPDSCVIKGPMPESVWITGLENQPSEEIERWVGASRAWSESGKIFRDRGDRLPSVCIALPASKFSRAPTGEIFFKVHYWWGMPSLLETRLLCAETDGFSMETIRWRECIIPHLCAGDLFLLPYLSKVNSFDEKKIGSSLMEAAQKRGWTKEFLIAKGAGDISSTNYSWIYSEESPSFAPLFTLWSEGIVNSGPCLDFCYSSPALQVMGKHAEIRHRLWCGQLELVMPMLNMVRLAVCNYLTKKYGRDWPVEYFEPKDHKEALAVRESPLNCQFGHLETLLSDWPGQQKSLKLLAKYLNSTRLSRNEIAHNRTITFADFLDLRDIVEKITLLLQKEP